MAEETTYNSFDSIPFCFRIDNKISIVFVYIQNERNQMHNWNILLWLVSLLLGVVCNIVGTARMIFWVAVCHIHAYIQWYIAVAKTISPTFRMHLICAHHYIQELAIRPSIKHKTNFFANIIHCNSLFHQAKAKQICWTKKIYVLSKKKYLFQPTNKQYQIQNLCFLLSLQSLL